MNRSRHRFNPALAQLLALLLVPALAFAAAEPAPMQVAKLPDSANPEGLEPGPDEAVLVVRTELGSLKLAAEDGEAVEGLRGMEAPAEGLYYFTFEPGERELVLSVPGHEARTLELTLLPGQVASYALTEPAGGSGAIHVETVPSGAMVTIDGTPVPGGDTPITLTNLAPGEHHLLLEHRRAYAAMEAWVTVIEGQTVSVRFVLQAEGPGSGEEYAGEGSIENYYDYRQYVYGDDGWEHRGRFSVSVGVGGGWSYWQVGYHSPGWYDPWYGPRWAGWYDPWYGWYDPWYGWHDPWHGWYAWGRPGWHRPGWGWYTPPVFVIRDSEPRLAKVNFYQAHDGPPLRPDKSSGAGGPVVVAPGSGGGTDRGDGRTVHKERPDIHASGGQGPDTVTRLGGGSVRIDDDLGGRRAVEPGDPASARPRLAPSRRPTPTGKVVDVRSIMGYRAPDPDDLRPERPNRNEVGPRVRALPDRPTPVRFREDLRPRSPESVRSRQPERESPVRLFKPSTPAPRNKPRVQSPPSRPKPKVRSRAVERPEPKVSPRPQPKPRPKPKARPRPGSSSSSKKSKSRSPR